VTADEPRERPPAAKRQRPGPFAGRWRLDLRHSLVDLPSQDQGLRSAELNITKDDGEGLAWTLVHEDGQGILSIQCADAPMDGTPSRSVVDGRFITLRLRRETPSSVAILTGPKTAPRRTQRLTLITSEILAIHDVPGDGPFHGETWTFVRASTYPRDVSA
jgi:hypothetical protein